MMVSNAIKPVKSAIMRQRAYIHTSSAWLKQKPNSQASPVTVHSAAPLNSSEQLSDLLLELSKSSRILHTGADIKGYSRPASSVVSKEPNNIFDDRKLFHGALEAANERDVKTIDLTKKLSEVIQPNEKVVHKVDSIHAFTSNDLAKKKPQNKKPVYVRKLSDNEGSSGDLKVDLDSVLSFLNKNVR